MTKHLRLELNSGYVDNLSYNLGMAFLDDPSRRQEWGQDLVNQVYESVRNQVVGVLGVGSFWKDGRLDTGGRGRKDMDVLVVIRESDLQEAQEIRKRFVAGLQLLIGGLSLDCGLAPEDVDSNEGDPMFLAHMRGARLLAGEKPKWLPD